MRFMVDYLRGAAGPSGYGSKSTAEDVTADLKLSHLTAIITGATSGIGAETAKVLAKRGVQIVVPARNLKTAEALKNSIHKETPNARIIILKMDLSSLNSVRSFVDEFLALNLPLSILINNAGVVCRSFKLSEDGFEIDFATNHLGHFLLTNLLLDKMIATAKWSGVEGRIVNVSSSLHRWVGNRGIQFDKLNDPGSFVESLNYAQSKLANILHAKELARRLQEANAYVTVNSLHPGLIRTNITRDRIGVVVDFIFMLASIFMKSIPQVVHYNTI
eukprot:c25384_g1_i1 orf=218-1042(+)